MTNQPRFVGRVLALVQGQVPSETLEAYRRVGNLVYDALHQLEAQRLDLKIQGLNAWTAPTATQLHALCVWNAFVLQTLGDEYLDADYRADPPTVGFVPPNTAAQIYAFYGQVEGWLSRAHQARSTPTYRLDLGIPAALPNWNNIKPYPRTHLIGMMAAIRLLRAQVDVIMTAFEVEGLATEQLNQVRQLRQLLAETASRADYVEQLWEPKIPEPLHERLEEYAQEVLERYYQFGQMLAMPQLIEQGLQPRTPKPTESSQTPSTPKVPEPEVIYRLPLPGEEGFDPWCLTDPSTRAHWQQSSAARTSIREVWAADPRPDKTLAVQAEINLALDQGTVDYATDASGKRVGYFYRCPWAPIYVAKASIVIGGQTLHSLQEFTYDVTITEGSFKRGILVGNFRATPEVRY